MRFRRVELGDFAGGQGELAFPDDDADRAGEDVEPFVALVGDKFRFPGRQDLLEDLDAAWVLSEGDDDAALAVTVWLEVDARIPGRRRGDELVERDVVDAGEGYQQIERGPALA